MVHTRDLTRIVEDKTEKTIPNPKEIARKDPEFIIRHGRFITGGALAWVGQDLEGLTGSKEAEQDLGDLIESEGGLTRSNMI